MSPDNEQEIMGLSHIPERKYISLSRIPGHKNVMEKNQIILSLIVGHETISFSISHGWENICFTSRMIIIYVLKHMFFCV